MGTRPVEITPDTKVAALLDAYPELEEVLVGMAPAFAKLRNPVLRRTVAKITSLRQAARVGNVPLGQLINGLREAAGQAAGEFQDDEAGSAIAPDWLEEGKIAERLDARPLIEAGERPMEQVMSRLKDLPKGAIFELTTPFEPAPLIDAAKQKGFAAWYRKEAPDRVKTYFVRRAEPS